MSSVQPKAKRAGRLKIYLGMAAGVGKTYSMLADARSDLDRGQDVVVGYVEPHGRVETESLLEGLPSIPIREIDHRGVKLKEFDLEAALARSPGVLLVDELAHTNASGSRHVKRWQDVAELLEAGIDVRTTVNIQHVESLRDVVAKTTGVFVQETVPDGFFDSADEVELVDLPPEELHQRLQEGKVYVPEKIDQALTGFFKRENLMALRELALRNTAERVDEEMRRFRSLRALEIQGHTKERILVCVAPNRMAPRVVREAKRLATNLHAELLAVSVESPRQGGLSDKARSDLDYALNLAKDLGAATVTLGADDIVEEVLRFARAEGVTTIVVGKPVRKRWREILFGSVVDSLIRASGEIDVLVITGAEELGTPLIVRRTPTPSSWQGYGFALIIVGICTGLGFLMFEQFDAANIIMVYLLGVAVVASRLGRRESLFAAILAVAAFDISFVPPRGTFAVSDVQYLVTFGIMLVVSYLISTLTIRLKDQNEASTQRERSTAALYDLSRQLASMRVADEMAIAAATKASHLIEAPVTVIARPPEGDLEVVAPSSNGFEKASNEWAVAVWASDHGKPAGRTTDTLAGSAGLYFPLRSSHGCLGVLGVDLSHRAALDSARLHLLEAITNQLAGAIDRSHLARATAEATLAIEGERLRSSLLSSASHDLRTPLSSIEGAAGILAGQTEWTDSSRELAVTIREEAERLGRLVRNLLDMTRVESGATELNLDWYTLEELIANAIRFTAGQFERAPEVIVQPGTPLGHIDGVLIQQVFVNLLENAARHAGSHAAVQIRVGFDGDVVFAEVQDDGPGIGVELRDRVFQKFDRSSGPGFGLGLTICRAIMQAHCGSIAIVDRGAGATFRLEFPRAVELAGVS